MKPNHIAIEVSQDEHYRSPMLKQIKENWPSLAKDYRHYCHVCHPKQGDIWIWASPEGQKFVHFIIEDSNNSILSSEERFHFFKICLKHLMKVAGTEGISSLELPKGSFKFSDSELANANEMVAEAFANLKMKNSSNGEINGNIN